MKRILSILICVLTFFTATAVFADAAAGAEIYVSLNGSDNNQGTKASPFLTLHKAQKEARKLLKSTNGDVTVNVGGGIHYLTEPLMLTDEDSGVNGKMIYKSTEDAVISGGLKLNGKWEQHDGSIYKINVPESFGDKYIAGLYINGQQKKRSVSDTRIQAEDLYTDADGVACGFIFSDERVANIPDYEDVELGYYWQWRFIMAPAMAGKAMGDGKTALIFRQPDFDLSTKLLKWNRYGYYEYDLYNSYSFLDEAGEFYYDRSEHTLYYVKGENENLDNALTIVPNIEKVVDICGTDSNHKAKNIEISGFTFSHTAGDNRVREYIFHPEQDSIMQDTCYEEEYFYPQITEAIRPSVWLSYCDSVSIKGNTFCQIQGQGIGLYDGVTNCDVTGNAFFELASSAIKVGLVMHEFSSIEKDGLTNVSARKHVTSSDMMPGGNPKKTPESLTHGNYSNGAWYDKSEGDKWVQVDLEEAHRIKKIYITSSYEHNHYAESRSNYDILASNDPEFATYEIIGRHGDNVNNFQHSRGYLELDINDPAKYRYVRAVKKGGVAAMSQFIVMTDDMGGIKRTEMPKNNRVANNYISDVCQMYYASVPIEIMYTAELEVTHNEVYNAPYSSLTMGWGWERGICKDNINNTISFNRFENGMLKLDDGAHIYVLDRSEGSMIEGNYLNGAFGFHGGIYFDNGSEAYSARNNVVERTTYCVSPWNSASKDISIWDNHTSTPQYRLAASNSYVKNMEIFVRNHPTPEAQKIIDNAGLEPQYRHLRNKFTSDIEKFWELQEMPDEQYFPLHIPANCYSGQLVECSTLVNILEASGLIDHPLSQKFITDYKALEEKSKNMPTFQDKIEIWWGLNKILEDFTKSEVFDNGYKTIVFNDGVPIDDSKVPVMKSGRVDGNAFVNDMDTFRFTLADDAKADTQKGEMYMRKTGVKNVYYTASKFGDVMFEFDFKYDYAKSDFSGFVLRGKEPGTYMETASNCAYSFNFNEKTLDIQRFNGGVRTVLFGTVGSFVPQSGVKTLDVSMLSKDKMNHIKVGAFNVENGVRIYLEANGQVLVDYVDDNENALVDPGYFSFLAPIGKIYVGQTENAINFTDLENAAWAKPYIYLLTANDIIKGRGNGIYGPLDNVTYEEWVALLTRTFEGVTEGQLIAGIPTALSGSLNRENAAVMLANAMEAYGVWIENEHEITFSLDGISPYALSGVEYLGKAGLVSGDNNGNFNPKNSINRAECAKLVFMAMQYAD